MNSFDAVVVIGLVVAIVTGFNAGFLHSLVTILGYLVAMPIAVWIMSLMSPQFDSKLGTPLTQNSLLFFGVFLVAGMVLGKSMRMTLDETIGHEAGLGDRLAGAALGAARLGLVAVTLVLIFDQLVPAGRQPAYLTGSQLRPWLSAAGQKGFRSLPPDVTATIDRLKKEHGISERRWLRFSRPEPLITAANVGYSDGVEPSKNQPNPTGVRQWILESKAAAPSCAHPARAWDGRAPPPLPPKACMSP